MGRENTAPRSEWSFPNNSASTTPAPSMSPAQPFSLSLDVASASDATSDVNLFRSPLLKEFNALYIAFAEQN